MMRGLTDTRRGPCDSPPQATCRERVRQPARCLLDCRVTGERVLEMTDEETTSREIRNLDRRRRGIDIALTVAIWVLVVAVLGLGGFLGYGVWNSRQSEGNSNPALRAIRGLEDLVRKNPNNADARVRLGEAYATAGMYREASNSLQQALKLNPKHSGAYFDLGMVMMAQTQPRVAAGYFQKVLDLTASGDSSVAERREQALFYLGQIAVGDKRWNDAVQYLKAALRTRQDASDTYYFLAVAYEGLKDLSNAQKNLSIALAFDPKYAAAHYELGRVYRQSGREASAAVEFRTALDLAPLNKVPLTDLRSFPPAAQVYASAQKAFTAGDMATAESLGLETVAIDPTYVQGHLLLARVFEKQGDKKGAISRYQKVEALDPSNPDAPAAIKRLGG